MSRILVGVDGSGPSRAALTWALKRARSSGQAIVAVHVVDDEWGQLGTEYAQQETAEGARLLAETLRLAPEQVPEVAISSELLHGSPSWQLAAAADPDDLLVVGTHKTGYLHGRVLGTRSIVVASVAPSAVAVVPEATLKGRSGVVVGVAPGDTWRDAVIVGAREAAALGQNLTLVHAVAQRDDAVVDAMAAGRSLLAEAAALAVETSPGLVVRSRVSRRQPAEALLDASHTAALLVLGVSRRAAANAGFVGSVSHDVLLNINCVVLVARLGATNLVAA
jgi:nucleotide-binding universal stress UspA family protein